MLFGKLQPTSINYSFVILLYSCGICCCPLVAEFVLVIIMETVCLELVQDLLKLEAIQAELAEYNGGQPTFSQWATAAGTDEKTLRKRLDHGIYCKNRMVTSNVRLVISIAREFEGPGMDLYDLIQVIVCIYILPFLFFGEYACILLYYCSNSIFHAVFSIGILFFRSLLQEGMQGLIRGAEKFDASKGFRFSTYSHWWIKQAMRKSVSEQSQIFRLPVCSFLLRSLYFP